MSRLQTMARFAEPDVRDEPKILAYCCHCDEPLEEGTEAVKFDNELFCDRYCLCKYYDIKDVVIGEDF